MSVPQHMSVPQQIKLEQYATRPPPPPVKKLIRYFVTWSTTEKELQGPIIQESRKLTSEIIRAHEIYKYKFLKWIKYFESHKIL